MPFPFIAAIGAVQGLTALLKGDSAAEEAATLRASRKSFKTSDEVYDIVNMTKNRVQTGYDPATLQYLDTQIDNTTAAGLGTAARLGADPNDLSAMFDQSLMASMKVGSDNAAMSMENFGKYIGAKELLSKNLDAEWASQQGLIKDDLQAAAKKREEAAAQLSGGINTVISGISSAQTAKLYQARTDAMAGVDSTTGLPQIEKYVPEVIRATPPASTQTIPTQQTLSQTVTPESNFMRGRTRIIGIDGETGQPIYGR